MADKQVYVVITGRVQGVGFRYFALDKAEEFHIKGWVRNTHDGKVEMEACGESKNLDMFIDWMKMGPSRAIIHTFSVADIASPRNFTNFTVR